jgi:hypothetical protein
VTACSGTVIDPHFVLTAGHCIVPEIARGASVVIGSTAAAPTAAIPVALSRVDPAYDPVTRTHDAALLVLAGAAPVAPVPLAAVGPSLGASVKMVGWGETAGDAGDYGTKRTGTALVVATDALTFQVGPGPSLPCTGDSGGPALLSLNGAESIVGITSHGDPACVVSASYTRADAVTADFIEPTFAALGAGSASPGTRCLYPEQCAGGPGACVTSLDEPGLAYCTEGCSASADCPSGMLCVAVGSNDSQCRYPVPTPGAFGGRCVADSDCLVGVCASGACSIRCTPAGETCPGDSVCEEQGTGIDFFCVAPPPAVTGSACAVVSPLGSSLGALPGTVLSLGAVVAIGRRRRRAGSMRR